MKSLVSPLLALAALAAAFAGPAIAADPLTDIPANIRDRVYPADKMDPAQPLGPSAYRDWKPKKGPGRPSASRSTPGSVA